MCYCLQTSPYSEPSDLQRSPPVHRNVSSLQQGWIQFRHTHKEGIPLCSICAISSSTVSKFFIKGSPQVRFKIIILRAYRPVNDITLIINENLFPVLCVLYLYIAYSSLIHTKTPAAPFQSKQVLFLSVCDAISRSMTSFCGQFTCTSFPRGAGRWRPCGWDS